MYRSPSTATVAVVVIGLCNLCSTAAAQTTAAAPQTFWNWMGIPSQPLAGLRNRSGNFPGCERKPPLKAIADPANLASDNAAIKKAAEIKAQEDMAAQKIKAIKYLAEIGCGGCYEGVDKALAEALDDCTEAVRYEAVKAILAASACGQNDCIKKCVRQTKTCKEAMGDCWVGCLKRTCGTMHLLCGKAGPDGVTLKSMRPGYGCGAGGNCPGSRCACGDGNCCTSEILNKLSAMAFEKNDQGCWKEPSPRVRAMARQALRACGPNIRPMTDADIPVPEEVPLQTEAVPATPGGRQPEAVQPPEPREEVKPEPRQETAPEPRRETEPTETEPTAIQSEADVSLPEVASSPATDSRAVEEPAPAGIQHGVADQKSVAGEDAVPADEGEFLGGPELVVAVPIPVAPEPEDLMPTPDAVSPPPATVAKGTGKDDQKAADSRFLPFFRRR